MTPTPLLNILTENKLNKNNYKESKRNLMIVLSCEKLKTVLNNVLASITNTLYKQLESYKITKAILGKLEDMFGGQTALAQQSAITSLINAQQKADTLVKDHMITLMGYFVKVVDNKANLDENT
ncbi:hypothetical protein PVK06_005445 [Gossypium arboreum]|uniref:Uncharacterized protein n=1 Tax=Gossypium arboreum TaxID=29729 RepID=A0ABR0QVN8_GOSAR|nr:hypothetical protein PVK06_005445 [Gossypium arboreum]